ncbi:MAG: NADH-quinone oxidoreductase subunit J, partial [Sphingobacteriia bacterium]
LIVNFFAIGGLFLSLGNEFLAVVQIIVYAGAIMVLFLFVIMLLNLSEEDMEPNDLTVNRAFSYMLGLAFLAELLYAFGGLQAAMPEYKGPFVGKVEPIGRYLMTDYVFPFEMISVVLLVALLGAMAIAKKHGKKLNQTPSQS